VDRGELAGGVVIRTFGIVCLACGALAITATLSAMLHLSTGLGHAAAADMMGMLLSSRVRGTATIDEVTHLGLDMEMRGFRVVSPGGVEVISVDRVTTTFHPWDSIARRAIVLYPCDLEGGAMRISRGPADQIDLVHAMEVPDDRFMIDVQIRDIRLLQPTVSFALPGVPVEVQLANVYGLADATLGHQFVCRVDRVNGYVNIPIVHLGFRGLNGRIRSDDATPLVVRMALELEVADPTMEVRYRAPGAVGREGGGSLSIELGADVPDEGHVATRRRVADAR